MCACFWACSICSSDRVVKQIKHVSYELDMINVKQQFSMTLRQSFFRAWKRQRGCRSWSTVLLSTLGTCVAFLISSKIVTFLGRCTSGSSGNYNIGFTAVDLHCWLNGEVETMHQCLHYSVLSNSGRQISWICPCHVEFSPMLTENITGPLCLWL